MVVGRGVRQSLQLRGIGKLVLVNAHGGNYVLNHVVLEANASGRCMTLFPVREDWDQARQDAHCVSTTGQDMHAGELGTGPVGSIMVATVTRLTDQPQHPM